MDPLLTKKSAHPLYPSIPRPCIQKSTIVIVSCGPRTLVWVLEALGWNPNIPRPGGLGSALRFCITKQIAYSAKHRIISLQLIAYSYPNWFVHRSTTLWITTFFPTTIELHHFSSNSVPEALSTHITNRSDPAFFNVSSNVQGSNTSPARNCIFPSLTVPEASLELDQVWQILGDR